MSLGAILLRVLLCLALVFNVASTAVASVHAMQMDMHGGTEPMRATASPGIADDGSSMPCHHGAHATSGHGDGSPGNKASKGGPVPDCCKSDACDCACIGHACAMVAAVSLHGPMKAIAVRAWSMVPAHPAPPLPHLIRPPIG